MMSHTKGPAKDSYKQPILAPEEVTTDGWYTFNVNPAEQYSYEEPIKRWNDVYKLIQTLITDMNQCALIEGTLEVSRNGRIHMHGYLQFKDIIDFYLRLPKMLSKCTIKLDYITDYDKWEAYCTKQKATNTKYKTDIRQDDNGTIKQQFQRTLTGDDLEYGVTDPYKGTLQFFTVKEKPKKKIKI